MNSRRALAWDTETALFRPGVMAPELACVTFQSAQWLPGAQEWQISGPQIRHHTESRELFDRWLSLADITLVGHNVAFDMAVMGSAFPETLPGIFSAYNAGRVTDTMLRQKLLDIAAGCYRGKVGDDNRWIKLDYSLLAVTKRHTGRLLEKDEWRLRYGEMRDIPLSDWPEGARAYPLEDARATLDCWLAQEPHAEYLADQYNQARKALWLHLASCWGLRTNAAAVGALRAEVETARDAVKGSLVFKGLVRPDGSRDTKAAAAWMTRVCAEAGKPLRATPAGGVCLDGDACEASEDATLQEYAEYVTLGAILSKDVPALAAATVYPIHTRFDIAESGRTTSASPNVQNWARGRKGGIGPRECFIPRPGWVYAQADYDGLELRTLAQVCLTLVGSSALGAALNAGIDPHTALASKIMGLPYAQGAELRESGNEDFDANRQVAKVANFGFPGGLGATKLVQFAKKGYGVDLTEYQAQKLKSQWVEQWPEMTEYFRLVSDWCSNALGLAMVEQLFTGRLRGGCSYTAACNSMFQGLGADATGYAGWLISQACYVDRSSPLYNSRIVNYIHDEFIVETPDTPAAHDAAQELARLMLVGAGTFLPDVPPKTKPLLMRIWSKKAKPVYGPDGRLVPWAPKV